MRRAMKNIKIIVLFAVIATLSSCVKEDERTPACGKWEVEINNPEATVKVENGRLIVDIPNPQSSKDVRLIQRQSTDYTSAEIGAWVDIRSFDVVGVDKPSFDAQITSSFAYALQPEQSFIALSTGNYRKRGFYNGVEVYTDDKKFTNSMHGKAGTIQFEVSHAYNAVQTVSPISASAKLYYLDFGIDPALTRNNPTASIHAEVEQVVFGAYVDSQREPLDGFLDEVLGFKLDFFDCNSLKN